MAQTLDSSASVGVLEDLAHQDPHVERLADMAVHAGLECGILGSKYTHWDMISFGPTICSPHSPDERVNIASVGKFWEYLKATLKNIPAK